MYSEKRTIDHILGHYTAHVREAALKALAEHNIVGIIGDANSPSSFAALKAHWNELKNVPYAQRRMHVETVGSDNTVFTDPTVNLLFRAWHDIGHMVLDAPFTREGETKVAHWMADRLSSGIDKKIMLADIIDQYDYWRATGKFVEDQRSFVIDRVFGELKEAA